MVVATEVVRRLATIADDNAAPGTPDARTVPSLVQAAYESVEQGRVVSLLPEAPAAPPSA